MKNFLKARKLLVLVILSFCLAIVILAHLQYFSSREKIITLYAERQHIFALQLSREIEGYFEHQFNLFQQQAQFLSELKKLDISNLVKNKSALIGYALFLDPNKNIISAKTYLDTIFTVNHLKKMVYNLDLHQPEIKIVFSDYDLTSYLFMSYPIYDAENSLVGYLLQFDNFEKIINKLIINELKKNDINIFLITPNGELIYHPVHPELKTKDFSYFNKICYQCHKSFNTERILITQNGGVKRKEDRLSNKLLAFAPVNLGKTKLFVVVNMPVDQIRKATTIQFIIFFVLSALMIGLVAAGSYYFVRTKKQQVEAEKQQEVLKAKMQLLDKIREQEKKYRSLVENSPEAVLIYQKGQVVFANKQFYQLFGLPESEKIDLMKLIEKEYHNSFEKALKKSAGLQERSVKLTLAGRNCHGNRLDLQLSIGFVQHQGAPAHQIILLDVTELRQKELADQQKERLSFLGELSARIAHEIKNPLAGIYSGIQIMEAHATCDEETREYFDQILNEVRRVDEIVKGLLNYAREENLEWNKFDLKELMHTMIDFITPTINNKKITFELKNNQSDSIIVTGDEAKIEQVLWNVINNAINAIEEEGKIEIDFLNEANKVKIRITDDGCGIPKENLKRIFQPFYTTSKNGTGLGLPISQKIIQAHGGTMKIFSQRGVGTTVEIELLKERTYEEPNFNH